MQKIEVVERRESHRRAIVININDNGNAVIVFVAVAADGMARGEDPGEETVEWMMV